MNFNDKQRKHICTNPGTKTIGFCPLNITALEKMTGEEAKLELRKWIAADAVRNPPVDENDKERFRARLLEATLSDRPFASYCGGCLEPFVLIFPERIG